MDLKQVSAMLDIINVTYYTRQLTEQERRAQIRIWSYMLANDDPNIVMKVIHKYIASEKFPPTVADIRKGIRELTLPSPNELLEILLEQGKKSFLITTTLKKKGENGEADTYQQISHAQEAFCSLPPILKKYVKNPQGLQSWYRISARDDVRKSFLVEIAKMQEETDINSVLMIEG